MKVICETCRKPVSVLFGKDSIILFCENCQKSLKLSEKDIPEHIVDFDNRKVKVRW